MIETEIGLILGKNLNRHIETPADLKNSIVKVIPAIELPDLGFADMGALKGVDIIAANVSARQFIVGQPRPVENVNLNAVDVTLFRNGREVNRGTGADALEDQWQAALWLVNKMIDQGRAPEAGQILLTGALGKMLPGKPGSYVADYGDFGTISFEIR